MERIKPGILRESERVEHYLPSINRSGLSGSRSHSLINITDDRNHVRFSGVSEASDPLFYPRPPSPSRQQFIESQEKLRIMRDEVEKKDDLIKELLSVDDTPRVRFTDLSKIDEIYSKERIHLAANLRSDNAALCVKVEGLQSQLREAQAQVDVREERIKELKREMELIREGEERQNAIVLTLRQQITKYEAEYGTLEGAVNRNEVAVHTLTEQNKTYQQRIVDLEARLRAHIEEKDSYQTKISLTELKFNDIINSITTIIGEDVGLSTEDMVGRLTEIVQENAILKGKLLSMKDYLMSAELETKASRETIMRLVSEAEREQKICTKFTLEMDNLRVERDSAIAHEGELKREIELLKERLDSAQRAWSSTKKELENFEARYRTFNTDIRTLEARSREAEIQLKGFKESLAVLLSDGFGNVEPFEEHIRDRIKMLLAIEKDRFAHKDLLEAKVAELTHQLETQYELTRSSDRRTKRLEADFVEMENRLRQAEGELTAGDVLRDGLRIDKDRYLRFLEVVSRALNMDPITSDIGMDMFQESILARCEQLVRNEGDTLVDRKTHIYNLQRKVKSLKEQLESKDLHMELLRKKVAGLEERLVGRTELERERDGETIKSRKLVKLCEKYKREIEECRIEIRDLKARLLESQEIRTRAVEQEHELEHLESKVGQLERVRAKQANKIAGLKDEVVITSSELGSKKEMANNTIAALTSELKTTKTALEEITKRERQLLDLRQVVSRMLGLDINTLAVPDYEIISRLEKLILANQSNTMTSFAVEGVLEDLENGFQAGYKDAAHVLATQARARPQVKKMVRTRARSASPAKRRDTRAY